MKKFLAYLVLIYLLLNTSSFYTQFLNNTDLKSINLDCITDSLISASKTDNHTGYPKKYKINYLKFAGITGVTAGAFWWLHNYQKNAWWSGQRGKFHFQNDWDYAMSADKLGHFFDGAFIQNLYQGAFEWSGFKPSTAMWIGALFSIAYMTDIEIEDGFARDWGFSPGDQLFNVAGAMYPVAQYYWKPLRSFNPKWSYWPSPTLTEGEKQGAFLDDYDGQTNWMSINIPDFLSTDQKFWPSYLNIVIGYGVNNYRNYEKRYADYYIGLDINWERIIPGNSPFMNWFKKVINHFRFLPLPALKINKNGINYSVNF